MNRQKSVQKKILIHLVAAARPNFMKIAPLFHALRKEDWALPLIVHTGQHYDFNMSDVFFEDLNLPEPHFYLGVGSGTHAEQTGQVMMAYEKLLMKSQPDLVIVVGDVNSTLACTLVASKMVYPDAHRSQLSAANYQHLRRPLVAHLEAGLRSFDRTMPEEINRILTDSLADILWTPSPDADENLIKEGILPSKIHFIGNIMIDSLEMLRNKIESTATYEKYGLRRGQYGVVTLHRPSNVDDQEILGLICRELLSVADKIPLIFPVHPRTQKSLQMNALASSLKAAPNLQLIAPLNYLHFMNLVFNCLFAITDSGGIQEETTYLRIPCLTLRPNTERPITVKMGTNHLCQIERLEEEVRNIVFAKDSQGRIPDYWDGQTAARAVQSLRGLFKETSTSLKRQVPNDEKRVTSTHKPVSNA